jgi:hypothetical protein
MPSTQSTSKIIPSSTGTADRLVTDLAKDFPPFVVEFLNNEGSVTRAEFRRTVRSDLPKSALDSHTALGGTGFQFRKKKDGGHELAPDETVQHTFVDADGTKVDYDLIVEKRELRDGEDGDKIVPSYSQAFLTIQQRPREIWGQALTFASHVRNISLSIESGVDITQVETKAASLGGSELDEEATNGYDIVPKSEADDSEHTIDATADDFDGFEHMGWGLVRRPESGAKPWGMWRGVCCWHCRFKMLFMDWHDR